MKIKEDTKQIDFTVSLKPTPPGLYKVAIDNHIEGYLDEDSLSKFTDLKNKFIVSVKKLLD